MFPSLPPALRALVAAGFFSLPGLLPVKATTVADNNTWLQFSLTAPLVHPADRPSPWRLSLDSPERFANDSHQYAQGTWRGAIGYTLTPHWSAWAGYGFSRTGEPYTRTPYDEHRPFQQLAWKDQAGTFSLQYRLRLEERLPDTGEDLGLRLRHQVRVSHPLPLAQPLSWLVWGEVFLNLNATDYGARRGLDQYRVFAGLGWQWSEVARLEGGYLHHFTPRRGQPDRVNHVLALSLALSFK